MMDTTTLRSMLDRLPLADGYSYGPLRRDEIDILVERLPAWYPDIRVGAASCYLRRRFYDEQVWFDDRADRDVYVLALRHGDTLAGLFSWDLDRDAMTVYGRLGVSAPAHRGARLQQAGLVLLETFGRQVGAGMLYGLATLKTRHVQAQFERSGWRLAGITPGYDRELVGGTIKRVYEAMYVKVLAAPGELLQPQHMTPATQALFELLFELRPAAAAARKSTTVTWNCELPH
jgi:hypothetical protein